MANNNEYYKVSFITTHSGNLPNMIKHTGALIVMSDLSKSGNGRKSIWLHGDCVSSGWGLSSKERMTNAEWLSFSYNKPFAPIGKDNTGGMTYFMPEDGIEDVPEFTKDDYGNTIGKPQTIKTWIDYSLLHTNKVKEEIQTYIDSINETIDTNFKKVNDECTRINNNIKQGFAYTYSGTYDGTTYPGLIQTVKKDTYQYINDAISRIVGGAPDYLDSLKEIKSFLDGARQNDMDTLAKISEMSSMNICREKELKNGYAYIASEFTYDYVDKTKTHTGTYEYVTYTYNPSDGSYTKNEKTGTYTYYGTSTYTLGPIAIEGKQVNAGGMFGDYPLTEILARLVDKYPYKKPEVVSYGVTWTSECDEYGQPMSKPELSVDIQKNDANSVVSSTLKVADNNLVVSSFTGNNASQSITSTKTIVPSMSSKSSIIESIMKEHTIINGVTISHTDAVVHNYPQFDDLGIKDDKDAFKAGSVTDEKMKISRKLTFKAFYGLTDGDVPNNSASIIKGNSSFLTSKETTGKLVTDGKMQTIWLAVPSLLIDGSTIYLESYSSGVKMDVTSMSTDSMKKNTTEEYNYNGMKYKTIYVKNYSFTNFADNISIEMIFN